VLYDVVGKHPFRL